MERIIKIGGATLNQTPIDWHNNTTNILSVIAAAKLQKVKLLCLPEMCITGYGCEDLFLSDWVLDRAWQELESIVIECHDIIVCLGIPVKINSVVYNGVAVVENQVIKGITLKQNMALDGVHYEPRWFTPWRANEIVETERNGRFIQAGDVVYNALGITFGFEICEDAWRVDRPGHRLCERGVDLILNPSASHFALGKSEAREKQVVIDGSKKFSCAYLFVNLLGNEAGRMIYDGDIIFGQHGRLLGINKRLSFKSFNLLSCEINFDTPNSSQILPMLDSKERNEEFARAESLALFDYLRKSNAKGFVLSLSGGADSSCCAVLVAEMVRRGIAELGVESFCELLSIPNKVLHAAHFEQPTTNYHQRITTILLTTAYQGTINSSAETLNAAKQLASSIGAVFEHWVIDEEVDSYTSKIEKGLGRKLTWETDDIAMQNIQARSRSPIIWLLANIKKSILLTTSNRSEGDVGYATMDGDTSGSLAPLAGIDKSFILQWLNWAEKELGYHGLKWVNILQPTAELRPLERTQTDEKDLMPYDLLVKIERLAIRDRKSPADVYQLLGEDWLDKSTLKAYIVKFFKMWAANQWKRERIAPSFHLDDFNVDPRSWCRFPILSGSFVEELAVLQKI
jgi:NAD+ synthase (glutamine-hydrolysing)